MDPLEQQTLAAQALSAEPGEEWERIVVSFEYVENGNDCIDNSLGFYLKKSSSGFDGVALRLSPASLKELQRLRESLPPKDGKRWNSCVAQIDRDGTYKFDFNYDPPKRINGILDEESYDRFSDFEQWWPGEK